MYSKNHKKLFTSIFLFSFFISLFCTLSGQVNLIPNHSFEEVDCTLVHELGGFNGEAEPWYSVFNTPDIYNNCNDNSNITGVPVNRGGYQEARTGVGYAHIYNHNTLPRTTEYFGVRLTTALKKDKIYYIRFFVSVTNNDQIIPVNTCVSDAIAIAFADYQYIGEEELGAETIPPFEPAIANPVGNILRDTFNWIPISGCYQANGTERYAIIGGFRRSADTFTEHCIGVTSTTLYIEDVGVYPYDPLPDTLLLCEGKSLDIGGQFLDGLYLWNTGATDSIITVTQAGTYILNTDMGNCILSDTVEVISYRSDAEVVNDTTICEDEPWQAQFDLVGEYTWSTGSSDAAITIQEAGFYVLTVTNDCGIFEYEIEVETEECVCNVYIPNAFSPNFDGINDYLTCYIGCDFSYQNRRFQVFDRWGSLVYQSKDIIPENIQWDGTFRNKPLDEGIYVWFFEYEYTRNGVIYEKQLHGEVTLLR